MENNQNQQPVQPAPQTQAPSANQASVQPVQNEPKKVEEFSLMWHLRVLGVIYLILIIFYFILKAVLK